MRNLFAALLVGATLTIPQFARAQSSNCTANGGGFCSYTGRLTRVYVNTSGVILLYLEADGFIDVASAENAGFEGLTPHASASVAFPAKEDPFFAKFLYTSALAAQLSGREVSLMMRGTYAGYTRVDRIWVENE